MTLYDFIIKSKNVKDENFAGKFLVTSYLPYERKVAIAEQIVNRTEYITQEVDGNEVKLFKRNTPARIMLLILNLIDEYTKVDINYGKALEEYNIICQQESCSKLIDCIPESERAMMQSLIDMIVDDIEINERSLTGYIDTKIGALNISANAIMDTLNSMIEAQTLNENKE